MCVTKSYLREMDSLAAWMSPSATPAMPNEGRCRQVPHLPHKVEVDVAKCLPRKVPWRHGRLTAPKRATRVRASPVPQAPHMPRKMKVDVAKCHTCHCKKKVHVSKSHACHANGTSMSPSATPATQSGAAPRATNGDQARHQSQPSATSATLATQMERQCHQVPRLPLKTKVHVSKSHACHANGTSMSPSATPATQSGAAPRATNGDQARHQSQPSATSATLATQMERQCHQVPRLPLKTKVHVSKSHACHANGTSMSPSATPATQSGAAPRATNGDQARHQSQPSATSATPATPNAGRCRQVPHLPRKWNVNVTKCHACHAKWRGTPCD